MLAAVLLIAVVAAGCKKEQKAGAGGQATGTIAPAEPQPTATDTADLTQTVDIEDGRSEAEGGALTSTSTANTTTTATTATTATTPPTTTTR